MKVIKKLKNFKNNLKKSIKNDFKNDFYQDEDEKENKRIILYIIIIVILLLLLITSCTSGFFGKIGNLFGNEGNYEIDKPNVQEILNKDLVFDADRLEMSETDTNLKISYSYKNIDPKEFSCSTSNASLATCYVSDGYVVINPKGTGDVTVYLQTETNGKIYKASTNITIKEGTREISLSSTSGTINLLGNKTKSISYKLIGLEGDVTVSSSDEKVATATIQDGIVKITAIKKGNAIITLQVVYNGTTYKAEYNLKVIESTSSIKENDSSKPSTKPDEKPDNKPIENQKSSDSSLKSLTSNKGTIYLDSTRHYSLSAGALTYRVLITATPNDSKASVYYDYKRADKSEYTSVDPSKKLSIRTGINTLKITVVAEDGSKSFYEVDITKGLSGQNYLKDISIDGATITGFNRKTLTYSVVVGTDVSKLHLTATPRSKNATITYSYNGYESSTTNPLDLDLNLVTGPNILKINVKAANGSVRTYTVNMKKPSVTGLDTDCYLIDLIGNINIGFNPYIDTYHLSVPYETDKLSLNAVTSSSYAKVTYLYQEVSYNVNDIKDLPLEVGENKVIIQVKNNGNLKEYTLNINRTAFNKSNTLTNITVSDGDKTYALDPTFNEDVLEYKVNVGSDISVVQVEGSVRNSDSSTVTVIYDGKSGNIIHLNYGLNKVVVGVTGSDASTRNYVLNIVRGEALSSDITLESITVNGMTVEDYKITVPYETENAAVIVKPNSDKATVTYNGSTNNIIPLKVGTNVVSVLVTAEDGTTYPYEVTIVRESNGEVIGGNIIKINGVEYDLQNPISVTVDEYDDDLVLEMPETSKRVTYSYNNHLYTDVNELNSQLNSTMTNGRNSVIVNIGEESYPIEIIKNRSYFKTMSVSGNNGTYDLGTPTIENGEIVYNITLPYNETNFNLSTTLVDEANSEVTYTLNGEAIELNALSTKLKSYENILRMTITSKDKTTQNVYNIHITKPERTIEPVEAPSTCALDKDCFITFKVFETLDGNGKTLVTDMTMDAISVIGGKKVDFDENGIGKIVVNANTPGNQTVVIGIKYYNNDLFTHQVTFGLPSYDLYTSLNKYSMNVSLDSHGKLTGEKDIILYTTLFSGSLTHHYDKEQGVLTITSGTSEIKVYVTSGLEYVESVQYRNKTPEDGATSVPIKITAKGAGEITLKVEGYAYNTLVKTIDKITIDVIEKYTLELNANGGIFDLVTKKDVYTFKLASDEELDLSYYEPFKSADVNNCTYYEFIEFTKISGNFKYKNDNKNIITISDNTVLYAKYAESSSLVPDDKEYTTMWIFDTKLFANAAANNETLIYPGASGKYKMNFTNTTGNKIKLVGFTLIEDTICVESGCLNMGYIIKYAKDGTYYLGNNTNATCGNGGNQYCNHNFKVLNQIADFNEDDQYSKKISIENPVEMENGEGITIYLDWKWVDDKDALDTAIGKKAATTNEETINNLYKLNIGIHYKNATVCSLENE